MTIASIKPKARSLKSVPVPTAESNAIEHHAGSMESVAAALNRVADEVAKTREQQAPMHTFFSDASEALGCARKNFAKYGPWLIGSIPVVLSLVNGVSPQVVKLVAALVGSLPK